MCKFRIGFGFFFIVASFLFFAADAAQAQKPSDYTYLPTGDELLWSGSAGNRTNTPFFFASPIGIFEFRSKYDSNLQTRTIYSWSPTAGEGDIYKVTEKTGSTTDTSVRLLVLTTNGKLIRVTIKPGAFGYEVFHTTITPPNPSETVTQICGDAVYALTTRGYVYVTSNDTTWQIDTAGFNGGRPQFLVLDTAQNVFAATFSGVYEQGPSAATWNLLPGSPSNGVFYLFASHADALYAPTNNGLMMSADHGATWAFDTVGMGIQVVDQMSDDSVGNLYATSSEGAESHSVWMKSVGGGWRSIGAALANLNYDSLEQVSQDYLTGVVADNAGIHVSTTFGLFSTTDGGATWNPDNTGIPAENIYNFYEFPDGKRIATTNLGLFTENAGDTTWNKTFPQNSYLPGIQFFVDNTKKIYAMGASRREQVVQGLQVNYQYFPPDIFVSTDEGSTWQPDTTGLSSMPFGRSTLSGQGLFMEFVDETGTEHVASYDSPHMRLFSKSPGGAWQGDSNGYLPTTGDAPSAFATDRHGSIYLVFNSEANGYRLFKRPVSGGAWSEVLISSGVPNIFTATRDGKLVGSGPSVGIGYYDGSKWTPMSPPIGNGSGVSSLSVDSTGRLWAAYGQNVFSTADLGKHWTSESDTSPYFVSMVSFGDTTYGLNSGNGLWYFTSGSAGVLAEGKPNVEVLIFPNPSVGSIGISAKGAETIRVEISDALGNPVTTLRGNSQVTWSRGSNVTAGIYFVRISGIDMQGKQYLVTKELSLE